MRAIRFGLQSYDEASGTGARCYFIVDPSIEGRYRARFIDMIEHHTPHDSCAPVNACLAHEECRLLVRRLSIRFKELVLIHPHGFSLGPSSDISIDCKNIMHFDGLISDRACLGGSQLFGVKCELHFTSYMAHEQFSETQPIDRHSDNIVSIPITASLPRRRRRFLATIFNIQSSKLTPQRRSRTLSLLPPSITTPLDLLVQRSQLSSLFTSSSYLLSLLSLLNLPLELLDLVIVNLFAVVAEDARGQRGRGQYPAVDGAGAAVAVVLEVEGAFYGWGEAGLFVAAGGEKFIVAAHRCSVSVCFSSLVAELRTLRLEY